MSSAVTVLAGDCLQSMAGFAPHSIDACVTDPPYHLTSIAKRFGGDNAAPTKNRDVFARSSVGFMGQKWDGGDIAFRPATWRLVFDALKPGAYLCAFSATRSYHRIACAIEDAGFVIRDQLDWLYGSGFPKSHNLALAAARAGEPGDALDGLGTALKPAHEPIVLAQKPLSESSIVKNVQRWGTGALNVRETRINTVCGRGRWPANIVHDGGDEVQAVFAGFGCGHSAGGVITTKASNGSSPLGKAFQIGARSFQGPADAGTPARFFYAAKASASDRLGSRHPTVKPVALMAWLVALVTPPGGLVLDPFAGSGTSGQAALQTGRRAVLCERQEEYLAEIAARLAYCQGGGPLFGVGESFPPPRTGDQSARLA